MFHQTRLFSRVFAPTMTKHGPGIGTGRFLRGNTVYTVTRSVFPSGGWDPPPAPRHGHFYVLGISRKLKIVASANPVPAAARHDATARLRQPIASNCIMEAHSRQKHKTIIVFLMGLHSRNKQNKQTTNKQMFPQLSDSANPNQLGLFRDKSNAPEDSIRTKEI